MHLEVDLEVLEPTVAGAIYDHVMIWRSLIETTDSNRGTEHNVKNQTCTLEGLGAGIHLMDTCFFQRLRIQSKM